MKYPTLDPCDVCGHVHVNAKTGLPSCVAHRKRIRPKVPCRRLPKRGMNICSDHGGRAPQVIASAAKRIARQEAIEALRSYGVPVEVDQAEAAQQMLWRAFGEVQLLERVLDDHPDSLTQLDGTAGGGSRMVEHIYRVMRNAAMDRTVTFAKICHAMGVEERQIQIQEDQGRLMAESQMAGFAVLFAAVRRIVPDELHPRLAQLELQEGPQMIRAAMDAYLPNGDET